MAKAEILLRGEEVFCSAIQGDTIFIPADEAMVKLRDWAQRYDAASRDNDDLEFVSIGREMFAWLDASGWASRWCNGVGHRELEVRVQGSANDERAALLLDAPWEILASTDGLLTEDITRLFLVSRRVGPAGGAVFAPTYADIQLMFMAASPEGQVELGFEAEEAAILEATKHNQRVHVIVEESGALDPMEDRLTGEEQPFEALHLSCHGTIDKTLGPVLAFETLEGGLDLVDPGRLIDTFGTQPPSLVMLSACRTAERGAVGTVPGTSHRDAASMTSAPSMT